MRSAVARIWCSGLELVKQAMPAMYMYTELPNVTLWHLQMGATSTATACQQVCPMHYLGIDLGDDKVCEHGAGICQVVVREVFHEAGTSTDTWPELMSSAAGSSRVTAASGLSSSAAYSAAIHRP